LPVALGFAVGVFSVVTDDPDGFDGVLLTLLIPTCAYALIAITGRSSWTWPLTGLVVAVYLAADALSLPGIAVLIAVTGAIVLGGALLGRWRPPPDELRWQPWGALFFLTGVVAALALDVTAAKIVLAVGLLLHGAWDIAHWRRRAVVSRSLAEWCAGLDITLGVGILGLVILG